MGQDFGVRSSQVDRIENIFWSGHGPGRSSRVKSRLGLIRSNHVHVFVGICQVMSTKK